MSLHKTLMLDLHGFWHAGSGRSAGALADALVHKNAQDLPVVGGRHLKGLLRHALAKAEQLGWFAEVALPQGPASSLEVLLFGSVSQQEGRYETTSGMLRVDDASLSDAETAWLAAAEQAEARQHLYAHLSATAINPQGSAKSLSLRTVEVTVPMLLQAEVQLALTASDEALLAQQQAWLAHPRRWQPLMEASTMLDSLGANRSRGLGEARFSWQDSTGEQ